MSVRHLGVTCSGFLQGGGGGSLEVCYWRTRWAECGGYTAVMLPVT